MSTINGTFNGSGTINGTVMRAINESIIFEMTSSSPEETTNTVLSTTSQNLGEIFCNIIIFHQTNTFPSTPHQNLGEIHSHPYHCSVLVHKGSPYETKVMFKQNSAVGGGGGRGFTRHFLAPISE